MKTPTVKTLSITQRQDFSIMRWLVIIGILTFITVYPYSSGLFVSPSMSYARNLSLAMVFAFLLFLAAISIRFRDWNWNKLRTILSIASLSIPFCYYISSLSAVSTFSAHSMTFISSMLSIFFILGLHFASNSKLLPVFLTLSCYSVVGYGLLNMFGQVYATDALWLQAGQFRLTSVFQYSNTYAGYLIAILFISTYWVLNSKRNIWIGLNALVLVPVLVSFMLTLSRGAIVVLPIILLVFLVFWGMSKQISTLLIFLISGGVTVAILGKLTEVYNQIAQIVQPAASKEAAPIPIWDPLALKGWAILLIPSLITVVLAIIIRSVIEPIVERRTARFENRKSASLWIPIASVGFGAIIILLFSFRSSVVDILPAGIAQRMETINLKQHSVLERATFYKDAMKVVADYPLFGTGGGGWSAVYEKYQNNPYVSRNPHSFFIRTIVEIGWFGFLVFLSFFAVVFYLYIRNYFRAGRKPGHHFLYFMLAVSLLIHSLIDFDMSYVYLEILVFFSMGAMLAPFVDGVTLPRLSKFGTGYKQYLLPAVLSIIMLVLFIVSSREYNAWRTYSTALHVASEKEVTLDKILVPLDAAIRISPSNPTFQLTKADLLSQSFHATHKTDELFAARDILARLKKTEPFNRDLLLAQYRNYKDAGDFRAAIDALEEGIAKFPWDIKFYEAAMMEYAVAGVQNLLKDTSQDEAWNRAISLYDEVQHRNKLLEDLPPEQLQGRAFKDTPFIRQAIGAIYFYRGDYAEAVSFLTPYASGDLRNPDIRSCVRYYLASLRAIGKNDENLVKLLIDADAHEKIYLDQLYSIIKK